MTFRGKKIPESTVMVAGILALFALLHISLLAKTYWTDEQGNIHSTIAGYGDIPLHMTQVSKFAFHTLTDLDEPIYYGTKLEYPFGINLISGLLVRLTHAYRFSFLAPVFFLAVINIVLVFFLYKNIFSHKAFALMAVLIFFLGSGWGAYSYLRDAVTQRESIAQFTHNLTEKNISTIDRLNAHWPEQTVVYGAPLNLVFSHQRPFFIGLAGVAGFMLLLLQLRQRGGRGLIVASGLMLGLLPLAHAHSFVAASVILGVWGLYMFVTKDYLFFRKLLVIAILAAIIALPQLWFIIGSKDTAGVDASFLRFRIGWMVNPTIGSYQPAPGADPSVLSMAYIKFLWINFGLMLPLFIIGCIALKKYTPPNPAKKTLLWCLAIAAILLFAVVQLVQFQPWDYDNNKLLVYWQLCAVPVMLVPLILLYERRKKFAWAIIVSTAALLLISGVIDTIPRALKARTDLPVIFNTDAQKVALYIQKTIPRDTLVLTGATALNPVSSLAGRPVLEGYPGWLWTRGIDYGQRENMIRAFYNGPVNHPEIRTMYPIGYVLLDDQVRYDFHADDELFNQTFTPIFESGRYTLYKL